MAFHEQTLATDSRQPNDIATSPIALPVSFGTIRKVETAYSPDWTRPKRANPHREQSGKQTWRKP